MSGEPPPASPLSEFQKLEYRAAELRQWLAEHAPDVSAEQRHLREGSQERKYWTYGYWMALRDVIALLSRPDPTGDC